MKYPLLTGMAVALVAGVASSALLVKLEQKSLSMPSIGWAMEKINESVKDAAVNIGDRAEGMMLSLKTASRDLSEMIASQPIMTEARATPGQSPAPPLPLALSDTIKRRALEEVARRAAETQPAAGAQAPGETPLKTAWTPEQSTITAEAVLVPRQVTVISSSQDGRIANVLVDNGDSFKKGDILIAYDCADLRAEADIVEMQSGLTRKKANGSNALFKLDLISDIDRLSLEVEDKQTSAKRKVYEARMQDCDIRALFDGRVTKRLSNPGEYTRTDRVLLEVASSDPLRAEFLLPSKWLRWINIGAPVTIKLGETDRNYTAKIDRLHGEVDPVSQSIQIVATLDPYEDRLLPGMSGQATLDINAISAAGIQGYLDQRQ